MTYDRSAAAHYLRCYVVLDLTLCGADQDRLLDLVARCADHGMTLLQLRDKVGSDAAMVSVARRLHPLCQRRGIPLLLNDRWQLVAEAGVDGVHLGQDDGDSQTVRQALGPQALVGRSIDAPADCAVDEEGTVDYVGLGPIFATQTKADAGPVVGLERLRAWRPQIALPVVAIGGIMAENTADVVAAGADGVAVVSAVVMASDPGRVCRQIRDAVTCGMQRRTDQGRDEQ